MDDAGEFFDPVAQLYDERYSNDIGDRSIAVDTRFYRDLARQAREPMLEVGVGTGRIYLELLADDLDVHGIDSSDKMVAQLRENARVRDLDPSVWTVDITDFASDREYGLIYAPARVFNHLATVADQRTALKNVYEMLRPGGQFALNTYVPRFEKVATDYGTPQKEHVHAGCESYEIVRTTHLANEVEQVIHLHWEIYKEDELLAERETPFALISKRQFELLFELTGFTDWEVYGGFDGAPLESSDQEMVWLVTT